MCSPAEPVKKTLSPSLTTISLTFVCSSESSIFVDRFLFFLVVVDNSTTEGAAASAPADPAVKRFLSDRRKRRTSVGAR